MTLVVQHKAVSASLDISDPTTCCIIVGTKEFSKAYIILDYVSLPEDGCISAVASSLPSGLAYLGVVAASKEIAATFLTQKNVVKLLHSTTDSPCTWLVGIVTDRTVDYNLYDSKSKQFTDIKTEIASEDDKSWWSRAEPFVNCKTDLALPLDIYANSTNSGSKDVLLKAIQTACIRAEQDLASTTSSFLLNTSSGNQVILSPSTQSKVQDLIGNAPDFSATSISLQATPLRSVTDAAPSQQGTKEPPPGPTYQYQVAAAGILTHHKVTLRLSTLAYVPVSTAASDLCSQILLPGLIKQLRAAGDLLAARVSEQQGLSDVNAYHFWPHGRCHHVTLLYPYKQPNMDLLEMKLAPLRMSLHKALCLPTNRPMLRISNALKLQLGAPSDATSRAQGQAAASQRLKNVHIGLQQPVQGAEVSLVDGDYDYYHYMQDRFNDNGWGCAYRSLQTLISWFRLQQYTDKAVPSHKEIQQLLVKLGDKQPDFVGSSEWIGAIELGYILDDYLGVTCKVITVPRGSDIPSYARQLSAHFKTHGTPVMIGGGVLAYTLLGVAFNELTGDCAFLILDPHYTGGEDLRKIQSGTWVHWKKPCDNAAAGGPLFVQDAFYNFLCPQRPQEV